MSILDKEAYRRAFRRAIERGCSPLHARYIATWIVTDSDPKF